MKSFLAVYIGNMTHAEIIEKLGDTRVVADALGMPLSTVSVWKTRGIAWRHRPRIATMAHSRGVLLPADFMLPQIH